jgi:hypothetical protein
MAVRLQLSVPIILFTSSILPRVSEEGGGTGEEAPGDVVEELLIEYDLKTSSFNFFVLSFNEDMKDDIPTPTL